MSDISIGDISWERMIRAVEKVRQRLERATRALERAGIDYAVAGGNAVAAWVSGVDEAAVRNAQVVDILIRLGLIGTIIGFIMIFASINAGQTPSSDNIQSLLLSMSGGMGTALYTTLLGLVSATLLGSQHMILARSVESLIARLIRIGQHNSSDGGS